MHGEKKMIYNFNFNYGVENEIVWCVTCEKLEDNVDNLSCGILPSKN